MQKYINIHTHNITHNSRILEIFNCNEDALVNSPFSYGIHPWAIKSEEKIDTLFNHHIATKPNCIAIGEIGLDRRINTPIEVQKNYFTKQAQTAHSLNKPIIIHCVKAYADFLQIRKKMGTKIPWIFHGFNANLDIATKLIQSNCYLSFGEQLMHSPKLQQVFKLIPLDHLFLETDDSELNIENLYAFATKILESSKSRFTSQLLDNFRTIFKNHNI